MLNFIKANGVKLATGLGTVASGLVLATQNVMAACTPGTGVLCFEDLKEGVGDPVVDAGRDTLVSALGTYWPIIILLAIFFGIVYLVARNFIAHRHGR